MTYFQYKTLDTIIIEIDYFSFLSHNVGPKLRLKNPRYPWANPNGARFIGNELRRCQFVGLSISWPIAGAQIGSGGHAITGWGDHPGGLACDAEADMVLVKPFDLRDLDRANLAG